MNFKFEVKEAKNGKGVFSKISIKSGAIICYLLGTKKANHVIYRMLKTDKIGKDYPLQVKENEYLVLKDPYVYFNHSCSPNSAVVERNKLIATKDIAVGEEITYDYSMVSLDETFEEKYEEWKMECDCGSSNCRKTIMDFHHLSKKEKQKAIKSKMLPDFILNQYLSLEK